MSRKTIVIAVIAVVLISTGIVLFYIGRKRKKERDLRYDKLRKIIQEDMMIEPASKGEDLASITLMENTCDGSYSAANADADALIASQGGWFGADDDEAVFKVLADKTGKQISCINEAMLNRHGMGLVQFIEDVFGEVWDSSRKDRAYTMINGKA